MRERETERETETERERERGREVKLFYKSYHFQIIITSPVVRSISSTHCAENCMGIKN